MSWILCEKIIIVMLHRKIVRKIIGSKNEDKVTIENSD